MAKLATEFRRVVARRSASSGKIAAYPSTLNDICLSALSPMLQLSVRVYRGIIAANRLCPLIDRRQEKDSGARLYSAWLLARGSLSFRKRETALETRSSGSSVH